MNNQIKVLLIDTNDQFGGVVRVHEHIIKHTDSNKVNLHLACLSRYGESGLYDHLNHIPKLKFNPGTKSKQDRSKFSSFIQNIFSIFPLLIAVFQTLSYCKKNGIQVIHATSKKRALYLTGLVHLFSRIPILYHIHGTYVDSYWTRRILKQSKAIVSISEAMKQDHLKHLGMNFQRIEVVHNGIDLKEFNRLPASTLKGNLDLSSTDFLFGIAGRICFDKGHDILLNALAIALERNPKLYLAIIGDDILFDENALYLKKLKKLISNKNIINNVFFLGLQHQMPLIYSGLDCLVCPSRIEGFGMVTIEPMACGTPVIASKVGGLPEIIDHEHNGLLFENENIEALSEAMLKIVNDHKLRDHLILNGHINVKERFMVSLQMDKLQKIYQKMIFS
jgi:L-malate glycosyltransferase